MSEPWTPERIRFVRTKAEENYSASHVARELGDVTRSAVLGLAMRNGIQFRAQNGHRGVGGPKKKRRRSPPRLPVFVEKPEPPPPIIAPPIELWTSFLELREPQCRFPVAGNPGPEMMCCGADRETDRSYCAYHCIVAYRPLGQRIG